MTAPTGPTTGSGCTPRWADPRLVASVALQLDEWGEERAWIGSDPYDGTNASRVPDGVLRTPRGRQLVAQVVKRCPIDLRHLLQVPSGLSSVTLANVVAAHALGGFLDDELHRARLAAATERLKALRLDTYEEPSWGYHWDAQSRVFFYPRSEPNGIATAFAGHALLDACERLEDSDSMALGVGAAEWFVRRVPRSERAEGSYFGTWPVTAHRSTTPTCSPARCWHGSPRSPIARSSGASRRGASPIRSLTSALTGGGATAKRRQRPGWTDSTPATCSMPWPFAGTTVSAAT